MTDERLELPLSIANRWFAVKRLIAFLCSVVVEIGLLVNDLVFPDQGSPAAIPLFGLGIVIVCTAMLLRAPWSLCITEDGVVLRRLLGCKTIPWMDVVTVSIVTEKAAVAQRTTSSVGVQVPKNPTLRFSLAEGSHITVQLSPEDNRQLQDKTIQIGSIEAIDKQYIIKVV